MIYPAKHFVTPADKLETACKAIEDELDHTLRRFNEQGQLLEAERLEMRTRYDLEMLREIGYCNGVENYSRHLTGRNEGDPPYTLLDYFKDDFVVFIDESHVTIPQIRGMHRGDRSRKDNLIRYGFRLPSAYDNRPLTFEEFGRKISQVVYVSATPAPYELQVSQQVVEQIIRPTGLVDPYIIVRPAKSQVDDLIEESKKRIASGERVLVTTLTKKMAEDLSEYCAGSAIKTRYLHSEIDTLERIQILRDLRLGVFDCLIGVNLLREGLDLPEVSFVAILDADKEGFLRSEVSLIQTIGRAARHVSGTVILYADEITDSMARAIAETQRRRALQLEYNEKNHIVPESIRKAVRDILEGLVVHEPTPAYGSSERKSLASEELQELATRLESLMKAAAKNLQFEKAAICRDELYTVREELKGRMEESIPGPPLDAFSDTRRSRRRKR